jgi:hypothetical protein
VCPALTVLACAGVPFAAAAAARPGAGVCAEAVSANVTDLRPVLPPVPGAADASRPAAVLTGVLNREPGVGVNVSRCLLLWASAKAAGTMHGEQAIP